MVGTSGRGADVGGDSRAGTGNAPWYSHRESITSAVVETGVVAPADSSYLFYGCSKLESLDLSGLDTSHVISMRAMFCSCSTLVTLDLSSFDTECVTSMGEMFTGCRSLISLDLSGFNTSRVEYIDWMFGDCSSLEFLDLSGFDTDAIDMYYYDRCHNFEEYEEPGRFCETEVDPVFAGCSSLHDIVFGRKFSLDGGFTALFELPRVAEGSDYAEMWEGMKDGEHVVLSTDELEDSYDGATMAGVWRRRRAL